MVRTHHHLNTNRVRIIKRNHGTFKNKGTFFHISENAGRCFLFLKGFLKTYLLIRIPWIMKHYFKI